jgi:serine/threonine-protein kinase
VATAVLEIQSEPAGAVVRLDGLDVGLTTPASLPGLTLGKRVQLELLLPGHAPFQQAVEVVSARQRVAATLVPLAEPSMPASATVIATPVTVPAPSPAASPAKPPPPAASAAPADKRHPAAATGRLSLRSVGPWVDVYLKGKKLGTTPLDHVGVPAGLQHFRLVNEAAGIAKQVDIDIPAGGDAQETVNP